MTLVDNAGALLRMAAIQLRRLAEHAPEIAMELRDLAGELDEEAAELLAELNQQNTG